MDRIRVADLMHDIADGKYRDERPILKDEPNLVLDTAKTALQVGAGLGIAYLFWRITWKIIKLSFIAAAVLLLAWLGPMLLDPSWRWF